MSDEGRAADQTRAGVGFVFGVLDAAAVPGPVIVQLLSTLGVAEPAVRQQLARMLRQGHLERERVGRVSVYRMTGSYLERWLRLREGDRPPPWTGAYEVVVHDIPERRRHRRELLVAAATRAGYASPRPGLLIGLQPPDFAQDFGADDDLVVPGRLELDQPEAQRLAGTAWRLDDRAAELARAVAELQRLLDLSRSTPVGGIEALQRLWTGLGIIGAARFAVPALPAELLPPRWPADHVQRLFAELVERCREPSGHYLYTQLTASPHASLVQGGWWPEVSAAALSGERPTGR